MPTPAKALRESLRRALRVSPLRCHSTSFQGQSKENKKAALGYGRDRRPDCKHVNIGLVVSPEGLPLGYEVFAGNRTDVTAVEEMVRLMQEKHGQAERIWVMDRGMVSEEGIDFLGTHRAPYLVGTPRRQRLKKDL
ncbi:MAG: transposase [Verrucomicrobiales bacterium]|nr:transposase [Verrucomicrobiales bacterium]